MAKDKEILEKIRWNHPITVEDLDLVKLGNQVLLHDGQSWTTLVHEILIWDRQDLLSQIDRKDLSHMLLHFKDCFGRTVIWALIEHMLNQGQQPSYYQDQFCFLIENGVSIEDVKMQYKWFHDLLQVFEECETAIATSASGTAALTYGPTTQEADLIHHETSSGSVPSTIGLEPLEEPSTAHIGHLVHEEAGLDALPTTVTPPTEEIHLTNHSLYEVGHAHYSPTQPHIVEHPVGVAPFSMIYPN